MWRKTLWTYLVGWLTPNQASGSHLVVVWLLVNRTKRGSPKPLWARSLAPEECSGWAFFHGQALASRPPQFASPPDAGVRHRTAHSTVFHPVLLQALVVFHPAHPQISSPLPTHCTRFAPSSLRSSWRQFYKKRCQPHCSRPRRRSAAQIVSPAPRRPPRNYVPLDAVLLWLGGMAYARR
jgi:hypothetical protein